MLIAGKMSGRIFFTIGLLVLNAGVYAGEQTAPAGEVAATRADAPQLYLAAMDKLKANDFAGAEALFATLARDYPDTPQHVHAVFWIGGAQLAQKKFDDAATHFEHVFRDFPSHAKAAPAGVMLAQCYRSTQQRAKAIETLQLVIERYPNDKYVEKARKDLAQMTQ